MMKFFLCCTLAAALSVLSSGCDRDHMKVYRVENSGSATPPPFPVTTPTAQPATMAAGLPVPDNSNLPELKYILPGGWQEQTPSPMRAASFSVAGTNGQTADVGVIPLPVAGQEIQLVNMWRDQLQLPAATNDTAEAIAIGADSGKLFDIASEAPLIDGKFRARILVAMLTRGETSWFFKMTGEDSFVASQKENLLQFLKSVSFVENAPAQISGTSLGSQNILVPNASTTANGETNSGSSFNSIWIIPSDWKGLPPSQFLLAEFAIVAANGAQADVNVAELTGEGGGALANANRWRGQLGLEPLKDEMELAHLVPEMDLPGGGHLTIVDFTGTDSKTGKPARLVGAIVPQNGQTWFYKLMGDEQIVAQQKDAFIKFIQSAKYPDAGNAP